MLINTWRDAIRYAPATDNGGQTDDAGETPDATTDSGESSETLTAEQALAELAATRLALKKANAEAAANRVKAKKLEDQEAARAAAEMSDLEKAQKAAADAQATLERYQQQAQADKIRHAVEMAASKLNFHDPADAHALADLTTIAVGDDGKVSGAEEALKALAKAKPHLVKSEQAALDINASTRGRTSAPTIDEVKARKMASGAYTPL